MPFKISFVLSLIASIFISVSAFAQEGGQVGSPKQAEPDIIGAGGEFTTKVAIDIPDYRGLPLGVSLNYNSSNTSRGGVENTVGFGWRLNATSMIERKSLGGGVPTFDDGQDLFLVDGQELMACNDASATNKWAGYYPLRYLTDQANASCSAGGNFSTRVESYRRILYDQASNKFTITRKDGTQLIYQSLATLLNNASAAGSDAWHATNRTRWLLTEVRDSQQTPNVVHYSYLFTGESAAFAHRLKSIDYAGYRVVFVYREYNAVGALKPKFATGTALTGEQQFQLRSIRIFDGTAKIRAYQITHQSSSLTKAQLVTKIQEFGNSFTIAGADVTGADMLPPTEFSYSADQVAFQERTYTGSVFNVAATSVDTNFDGSDELFMRGGPVYSSRYDREDHGYHHLILRTYTTVALRFNADRTAVAIPNANPACQVTSVKSYRDVNYTPNELPPAGGWSNEPAFLVGNARLTSSTVCIAQEFSTQVSDAGTSYTYYGRTYAFDQTNGPVISTSLMDAYGDNFNVPYTFANFDLDPDTEVLGSGLLRDIAGGIISGGTSGAISGYSAYSSVVDVTGDAVDDVLVGSTFHKMLPETGYVDANLKTRGQSIIKQNSGLFNSYFGNQTCGGSIGVAGFGYDGADFLGYGDIDGNGLNDVVCHAHNGNGADAIVFYPAIGDGFGQVAVFYLVDMLHSSRSQTGSSTVYANHRSRLADINSDGLVDLIIHSGILTNYPVDRESSRSPGLVSGGSWVFVNTGTEFVQVPINSSLTGFAGLSASGDYDGDGLTDIAIQSAPNSGSNYNGTLGNGRILFGNGGLPNRMVSVKDTAGGTLTVGYAPSSKFGTNQMPGVQQVVETLTRDDGRGGLATTIYSYVGGKYDFINRQTLGYKTVTAKLPAIAGETTGPSIVTTYLNDHIAEYGLVKSRIVTDAAGTTTYSRTINDYSIAKTGNGPYRAKRTSTREAIRSGTVLAETTTLRTESLFGEPLTVTNLGFTNNGADIDSIDNRITAFSYLQNLSDYIVSKPYFERVQAGTISNYDRTTWLAANYYQYDGLGNNILPTVGNVTLFREWTGNTVSTSLRTKAAYIYDAHGNVLTEVDARNQTTTHSYDSSKQLFRTSTTNDLGQMATTVWNMSCQTPQSVTDINSLATGFLYDPMCRETRRNLPTGNYQITRYLSFGDPAAQYVEKEAPSASNISGSTLATTREYFDGNGHVYKSVAPGSTTAITGSIVTLQAYDARGNLAWQSLPLTWGAASGIPPANQRISFTYDPLNRLLSTVQADGAQNTVEYVNWQNPPYYTATRERDAHCFDAVSANTICGNVLRHYDAYGRNSKETHVGGPQDQVTTFAYDMLHRLTKVTDPEGAQFFYTYDAYGNRITANDPGLGTWTMAYDGNGNLTQQTDAKGQVITFTHDALNRPTEKRVSGGSDGLQITTMTYDQAVSGYYNKGKLTRQVRGEHEISYDYHKNGQVARETHKIGSRGYVFTKTYTTSGALFNQSLPNQPGGQGMAWAGEYKYDAASRLTGLGTGTGTRVQSITYNLRNQPLTTIYGNGAKDMISYNDARGWATSIAGRELNATTGFAAQVYTRTATGRVSRINTAASASDFDYSYDYSGRLLAATNFSGQTAYNQSFTYDKAGRMLSNSRVGAYAYSAAKPFHAPKSINASGQTATVTYDANGNMTLGLDGKTMGYDGENRPLWVTFAGKRTCYVYAADGSRLKKVENLPANQNCATLPTNAETTAYFSGVEIRKFGQGAAEVILTYPHPSVRLTNGTVSYLHMDQLGSIRGITGPDGLKDSRATYRPFGEQEQQVYDVTATVETKGFVGERYDEDAGLQYLNARYYDPKLALFIQPDWFEVTKRGVGTNRYSYSFNDPVNGLDPGGNRFHDWGELQKDADKENRDRAESLREEATRARESDRIIDKLSVAFGSASRLEELAREYESRIGMSNASRIRSDIGDLVGHVLMGLRPALTRSMPPNKATVDFTVTPKGTAIITDQAKMRAGFDAAGFPKRPVERTNEPGIVHTVPTPKGKVDVRTMEGGTRNARTGEVSERRAVISTPGNPKSPRTAEGAQPQGTSQYNKSVAHFDQY